MLVKITVGHCLGGGRDVAAGAVLEVDDREAGRKIRKGYAISATRDDQAAYEKAKREEAAAAQKAAKNAEAAAEAQRKADEEAAKKAAATGS